MKKTLLLTVLCSLLLVSCNTVVVLTLSDVFRLGLISLVVLFVLGLLLYNFFKSKK